MPKRVSAEAKRVPLNCLVLPATLEYLRAADGSQGEAVDRAVAALKMREALGREEAETQRTFRNTKEAMLYVERNSIPTVIPVQVPRAPKPPLLKPKDKK